jgi:hypothetical protein
MSAQRSKRASNVLKLSQENEKLKAELKVLFGMKDIAVTEYVLLLLRQGHDRSS